MVIHPYNLNEQIVHVLELLASFDFILCYNSNHHLILFRFMWKMNLCQNHSGQLLEAKNSKDLFWIEQFVLFKLVHPDGKCISNV